MLIIKNFNHSIFSNNFSVHTVVVKNNSTDTINQFLSFW